MKESCAIILTFVPTLPALQVITGSTERLAVGVGGVCERIVLERDWSGKNIRETGVHCC